MTSTTVNTMKCPIGVAAGVVQVFVAASAYAQLSPGDVEGLRRRGEAEGWTFKVGENSATLRSSDELCGFVPSKQRGADTHVNLSQLPLDVPASFDWRTWVGHTPIKDQGRCGSCWAFATCGVLELNLLIRDAHTTDLSEQWLVSCSQDAWDCGGGDFAHDYHEWKDDICGNNNNGAVLEAQFPYVASDAPCSACPYVHTHWIDDWHYVSPNSEVNIKSAILVHGSVSAAVHSDAAFQAYNGGIFNACVDALPNHAIMLVGWDDNQGTNGVWILRNSWGTAWGEDENGISWDDDGDGVQDHDGGYMRIEYGCSRIGHDACYVEYPNTGLNVWVDFDYGGVENGTFHEPFNTMSEAASAVMPSDLVSVKAGSTSDTPTLSTPMTIRACGGTVTIGG